MRLTTETPLAVLLGIPKTPFFDDANTHGTYAVGHWYSHGFHIWVHI